MSGDPRRDSGGWLDLLTGETWSDDTLTVLDEDARPDIDADPDRWCFVHCEGSRATWRDRHDFASGLPVGRLATACSTPWEGRGAFGRFSRALDDARDTLVEWRAFGAERQRGRARALLASRGYTPSCTRPEVHGSVESWCSSVSPCLS